MISPKDVIEVTPEKRNAMISAITYYLIWLDDHREQVELRKDIPLLNKTLAELKGEDPKDEAVQPHTMQKKSWTYAPRDYRSPAL